MWSCTYGFPEHLKDITCINLDDIPIYVQQARALLKILVDVMQALSLPIRVGVQDCGVRLQGLNWRFDWWYRSMVGPRCMALKRDGSEEECVAKREVEKDGNSPALYGPFRNGVILQARSRDRASMDPLSPLHQTSGDKAYVWVNWGGKAGQISQYRLVSYLQPIPGHFNERWRIENQFGYLLRGRP